MAVSSSTNRVDYTAFEGQTEFDFTFKYFDESEVFVYQNGVLLTLGYTVAESLEGPDSGGKVTLAVGASAGDMFVIKRILDLSQNSVYEENTRFPPKVVEDDFDRRTMVDQQNQEELNRCIKVGPASMVSDVVIADPTSALVGHGLVVREDVPGEFTFAYTSQSIDEIADAASTVIAAATAQADAAAASASAAAGSASSASGFASAASGSASSASASALSAAESADDALAAVASVNLPLITIADADKGLVVNPTGTGYVVGGTAAAANVGTADGEVLLKESIVPTLKSSSEQAIAGTDDTTIMTPARVKDAVEAHVPEVIVPEPLRTPVTVLTATTSLTTTVRARGPADAAAGYPTGVLVGTSTASPYIQRSVSAGASWVGITASPAISAAINDAVWIGPWGKFVAVGNNGQIYTADAAGATWTKKTAPTSANYQRIMYSPELNIAVIIANSGTGTRVVTSSDGETWTARTTPADEAWTLGAWGNGIFLVLSAADGSKAMTSDDGIVWVARTVPAPPSGPHKVVYVQYLSRFCVVYTLATTAGNPYGKVKTTINGIDYTEYNLPVGFTGGNMSPTDIIVSEKNKRIIVPYSGGSRYIVSVDAMTWEAMPAVAGLPTAYAISDEESGELLWFGSADVKMLR